MCNLPPLVVWIISEEGQKWLEDMIAINEKILETIDKTIAVYERLRL